MTIARSHQNKEGSATKAAVPAAQQKQEPKAEESVYQKLSRQGVKINETAFARFPENIAKQSAQKVAEIVESVPWLSDYLNSKDNRALDITSKELRFGTMAQVEVSSRGDQKLFLSMNEFKDEKKLLEQMKRGVESRWMMPCSPESYLSYTIAHEMGHVIHNAFYEKTIENRIQSGELDEWWRGSV